MVFTDVNDDADVQETGSLPVSVLERRRPSAVVTLVSFGCWLTLIAVAVVWGRHLLDSGVRLAIGAAPLSGRFGWRISADALVPVVFAAAVIVVGPLVAARVSWARVVLVGCALSVLWAVALSRIDGSRALFSPFYSPAYLQTAQTIRDPHLFLSQFVQRIHSYNSHARGHPPGMELLLWATARVGLTGVGWSDVPRAHRWRRGRSGRADRAARSDGRTSGPYGDAICRARAGRDLVVVRRRVLCRSLGVGGRPVGPRNRARGAKIGPARGTWQDCSSA